jgi:hypothetical protein
MQFSEILASYYENFAKILKALCCQKEEILHAKAEGTYSYHCSLNM